MRHSLAGFGSPVTYSADRRCRIISIYGIGLLILVVGVGFCCEPDESADALCGAAQMAFALLFTAIHDPRDGGSNLRLVTILL